MTFVFPINYPGCGMSTSEIFKTTKTMRKAVFPNASKLRPSSVQAASKQCPSLSKHPIFLSKLEEDPSQSLTNHSMASSKLSDQLAFL